MSSPNQQTLLEMVQEILTAMQSDEVDSWSDTSESKAVGYIIRRTYWDLFGILDEPEHYSVFQLDETSAATPSLMTVPDNAMSLEWVKYNCVQDGDTDPVWVQMKYVDLDTLLDRTLKLPPSDSTVGAYNYSFSGDSIPVYYQNDTDPQCYATPDDRTLVFDAVNTSVDTYLKASKTMAYGLVDPVFTMSDSFVPDLDARQFPLLVNESKALAFAELKQTQHAKAEARARKLMISNQRTKYRVKGQTPLDLTPNYGRRK